MPVIDQQRRTGAGTSDNPLTDIQIQDLGKQGIYEGDEVAGKGILRPDGTFRSGVSDIGSNPVISSQDSAEGFKQDGSSLDSIINAPLLEDDPTDDDKGDDKDGGDKGSGDDLYDNYRTASDAAQLKQEEDAQVVLDEYDDLYKLELANIDARTRATTNEIKRSFKQRITEQKRINNINVDRVKAYGLSSGAAQYTPIAWTDAISERERKNSEEIHGLERERQELIDAAKTARDESDAALLSQKIKDYNSVKDKLNNRLKDIEAESKAQYAELRTLREEAEADFKEKQEESLKRLQAYYSLNSEEVADLSDEEKEALVNKIAGKYGFETYEVLGVLDQASATDFDKLQSEADIKRTEAQTEASNASAASSYANAAKTRKQTDLLGTEEEEKDDFTTAQNQTLEQAGLQDAGRTQKLDFLKMEDYEYEEKYPNGVEDVEESGDIASQAKSAGYDYEAMKAAGHSDEDIQAALAEAGV